MEGRRKVHEDQHGQGSSSISKCTALWEEKEEKEEEEEEKEE